MAGAVRRLSLSSALQNRPRLRGGGIIQIGKADGALQFVRPVTNEKDDRNMGLDTLDLGAGQPVACPIRQKCDDLILEMIDLKRLKLGLCRHGKAILSEDDPRFTP